MKDKIVTILLGNPRYFTPTVADCHWAEEPYYTGEFPPHYPVPALRTDMFYWRMPAFPTHELIYQWYLWAQGWKPAYYTYDAI